MKSYLLVLAITAASMIGISASAQTEPADDNRVRIEAVAQILFTPPPVEAKREEKLVAAAIEACAFAPSSGKGKRIVQVNYNQHKVGTLGNEEVRQTIVALLVSHGIHETVEARATEGIRPLGSTPSGSAMRSGAKACLVGTIGVAIMDTNRKGYLTCNHVAAAEGPLLCPNAVKAKEFALLQPQNQYPPDCDKGVSIGKLSTPLLEIKDYPTDNLVDAAFVEDPTGVVDVTNKCNIRPDGDMIPPDVAESAHLEVRICGATAPAYKKGTVAVAHAIVKQLAYLPCGVTARFVDQIRVDDSDFAAAGDSGSVAFDVNGAAVGLVFAGDGKTVTFLNPIGTVLHALGDMKIIPNK